MASRDSGISVVVCGSGNISHVLAGLVAGRKSTTLAVLVLDREESEEWSKAAKEGDFTLTAFDADMNLKDTQVKIKVVTGDPARALKKADMILLSVPVELQPSYLEAIAPHVEANMSIVGLPGQLGFELQCYHMLKTKAKKCCFINVNTQPFAGRIVEYGKSAKILSREESVTISVAKGNSKNGKDPLQVLQYVLGEIPELRLYNNFLESAFSDKCIIGPAIMYSKWSKWDGKPVSKKPLFYQELTQDGAKLISDISDELMLAAKEITKQKPKLELSNAVHIFETLKDEYRYNIEDDSSLLQAIKTNTAFGKYPHPMDEESEGKFVPDFTHRFLTEDVPYGLVILKGICLLVKMKTPVLDKVLAWCQEKIGKEYISGSKLDGKDLKETRAPQAYGMKSLDDLITIIS
ncbi:hypothetical protein LOTGIDRAFT_202584 [Lottia gigantea]|uniref:Opine dehydrogenase domain-containing protein n=1 Tax=Lottia gigantea TaxID=225164 RepID=V4ACX9_LOTGI|nr:hypothetical protein LOTGIDRAFT_202584 [Lottia gigantea]ESO92955.1 hypothetical protein LOTGIDRAFT_202584 [Lottia gigantea]